MMSSAVPEDAAAPAAPRAGADLRAARERLGWPIDEVSRALRIRVAHLEALEEGRIDLLPGSAYAVGFLRAYAKTLGLDPDEIARRFKAEARKVNEQIELVFPAPMPERGLPAGAVVLLGIVLAIGAYAGWYRLSGEGRLPAETVTPVPQRLATLAEQAAPPQVPSRAGSPSAAQQAAARPGTAAVASGAAPAGVSASGVPAPGVSGAGTTTLATIGTAGAASARTPNGPGQQTPAITQSAAAAPPLPSISPTSAAAAPVPPLALAAMPAAKPASAPPAGAPPQIVLAATANAWLEVRDRSGNILLNRVLHKGDSWPVPDQPDLMLTTGNAGGTEIVVNGTAYPVPGASGAVRRDLPLDADAITAGKLAVPAVATGKPGIATPAGFARPATQ